MFYDTELNMTTPIIEQLYDGEEIFTNAIAEQELLTHNQASQKVCRYLASYKSHNGLLQDYYDGITYFLQDPNLQRILLYLPFSELDNAPGHFRKVYLDAWYNLLNVTDARENFHLGDVFEPDARKDGQIDLIVKSAHLTPWLIKTKYLTVEDLERIIQHGQDDTLLLQSFADTFDVLAQNNLINPAEMQKLQRLTIHIPKRTNALPLYNSKARLEWLNECRQKSYQLLTPQANLAGPFSPNLLQFLPDLMQIQESLCGHEIVLISGSRLKGYSITNSDFDVFRLEAPKSPCVIDNVNYAFYCMVSAWMGGESVRNLRTIAQDRFLKSLDTTLRPQILRRLESGLLQYRLLQKGFQRFYHISHFATARFSSIDGDCAFYDENYRRIATQLFAKYVFLPTSKA